MTQSGKIRETSFYHSRIKDWPESERPREKMIQFGPELLSDAELIAILLHSGSGEITAVDLAKSLLRHYENLINLAGKDLSDMTKLKGIGPVKGLTLIAAFELGRRIAARGEIRKVKFTSPDIVANYYKHRLQHKKQELFYVILLNSANYMIIDILVSEGSLNASVVHPREVFKKAIAESAAGVIFVHNHPSGNILPSEEDKKITRDLVTAGNLLGIPVQDHIIVAGNDFFSFLENSMLNN